MVESTRTVGGKTSVERRFYITSLEPDAAQFARAVRGHWAIENTLHWSLDVSMNEDQNRVRTGHAAENLARLRHVTLNLLQRETKLKRGIKGKQRNAGSAETCGASRSLDLDAGGLDHFGPHRRLDAHFGARLAG